MREGEECSFKGLCSKNGMRPSLLIWCCALVGCPTLELQLLVHELL